MQFRVVIPETGVKAGQTIRIRCLDGTEANVKVPDGLKPGDSFIFELSTDQLNNPQALLDNLQNKPKTTDDDDILLKKIGFLDRDIVNLQDLLLALAVGIIVGFGIIFGFMAGILYATRSSGIEPQQFQTLQ